MFLQYGNMELLKNLNTVLYIGEAIYFLPNIFCSLTKLGWIVIPLQIIKLLPSSINAINQRRATLKFSIFNAQIMK